MDRQFYVYILASAPQGALYIGYTSDLARRVYEPREGVTPGFTRKHGVKRLVCVEAFDDPVWHSNANDHSRNGRGTGR